MSWMTSMCKICLGLFMEVFLYKLCLLPRCLFYNAYGLQTFSGLLVSGILYIANLKSKYNSNNVD